MKSTFKKSQAALEFLMTYGWAILVVLVAVGALAYFGVLSPEKFLPSKCMLQPGIGCLDFKATSTVVTVYIQNALGYDISSVTVKASGCGTDSTPAAIVNGDKGKYDIKWGYTLTGSKYNGAINITYVITETGISHTNQGTLTARLE